MAIAFSVSSRVSRQIPYRGGTFRFHIVAEDVPELIQGDQNVPRFGAVLRTQEASFLHGVDEFFGFQIAYSVHRLYAGDGSPAVHDEALQYQPQKVFEVGVAKFLR